MSDENAALGERVRQLDDATRWVLALTALALLARLVLLGVRVSHFDEGRVAWWVLNYIQTGDIHYRFIIHGTLIRYVDAWLWTVTGPSDFASRLPVAIVGGLLPLSALLFREHLRDVEVGALAFFLALNPVLLYYSRFMRSTMLVVTFMFVAFGLLVRAYDTLDVKYVHAAVVFVGFGFASKENAIVYLIVWVGATALVVFDVLARRRVTDDDIETGIDRLEYVWNRYRPDLGDLILYAGHAVLAVVIFLAIIVFFYAPRAGDPGGVGLYQALGNPSMLPELWNAMVEDIDAGLDYWFGHAAMSGSDTESVFEEYLGFFGRFLQTLASYAAPLFGLAIVGFFLERFGAPRPRQLVMFTGYWGFVSIVGYPLGTDIYGAWITANAIVPLAIPAAVGLGLIVRRGAEAYESDDRVSVGLAAVLLLLIVGQVAYLGVETSYLEPTADDNGLVQYAQPQQDWRETLEDMRRLSAENEGTDVLFYGDYFVDGDNEAPRTPACITWFDALSLPWYIAVYDTQVACANSTSDLDQFAGAERPPMVISRPENRMVLEERFPDYEVRTHYLRTIGVETLVLVDTDRLSEEAMVWLSNENATRPSVGERKFLAGRGRTAG